MTDLSRRATDILRRTLVTSGMEAQKWSSPPSTPDGEPIWVDLKFNLWRLADFDTVAGSAAFRVFVTLFWNDPRLVGHPGDEPLPDSLWGPRVGCLNGREVQQKQEMFRLLSSNGRLARGFLIEGTVDNPMHLPICATSPSTLTTSV